MRRFLRELKSISRSQTGAAAVEFAIVVPLLLFIVLTMLDVGRLLIVNQTLNTAAYEGARVAAKSSTRLSTTVGDAVRTAFPTAIAQLSFPGGNCGSATGNSCVLVDNPPSNAATYPCTLISTNGSTVVAITTGITFTFISPLAWVQSFGTSSWGDPINLRVTAKAVCLD
jgi:Flp pilus assembly protein TadG